jgi:hypothetical protein
MFREIKAKPPDVFELGEKEAVERQRNRTK